MKISLTALVLVLVLATALFAGSRPAFNVQYDYDIGQGARDILAIDFNGDGVADVATANELSSDVSTMMSLPNGTLFFVINVPVSGGPMALAGGDFDADGDNDIAVLCDNGTIKVLLNKGNGRFDTGPLINVGTEPTDIVAANFDGDQYCDLGVTVRSIDSVLIFHGDASAAMASRSTTPATGQPTGLATGDIDQDGDLDLFVVGWYRPSQLVLYNDGAAVFSPGLSETYENIVAAEIGDLTAEGYPEIVYLEALVSPAGDTSLYNVDVGLNSPDMGDPFRTTRYWNAGYRCSLAISDLDQNTCGDLIVALPDEVRVVVRYNDMTLPHEAFFWTHWLSEDRSYPVDGVPGFATAADLDGDSYPELLVLLRDRDQLAVMPNFLVGDLDNDRAINLADITQMIAFVYLGGQAPDPIERANVNGSTDGKINLSDITYLIASVYLNGPPPAN